MDGVICAETKQRTQRRIGPNTAICQITRPQTQLPGAGSKFHHLLAFPQVGFDLAPVPALHNQSDDHRGLQADNGERAYDPPLVPLPNRRLPEFDHAAGWQAALADVPAPQFPPVVSRLLRANEHRWKIRHWFAAEDSHSDAGGLHALELSLVQAAADDPQ